MSAWSEMPITFFFGAGASKAIAPDAPIGDDLLKEILHLNEGTSNEIVQELLKFMNKVYNVRNIDVDPIPRIEDVLSLLDLYCHERLSLTRELRYEDILKLKDNLIFLMCKVLETKLAPELCPNNDVMRMFVGKLMEISNPKVSLISTNYDIVLDNELFRVKNFNYGIIVRSVLEPSHHLQRGGADMWTGVGGADAYFKAQESLGWITSSIFNRGKIPLYKIHGSLNWLWCPRCQELDITAFEKGALRAQERKYLCTSKMCTSPYETLIVSPTMFKVYDNRIIKETWERAERAVSTSKFVIFIGYSLQDADIHIRCMLTRAISNSTPRPVILVVNFYDENDNEERREEKRRKVEDTEKRYKHLFGDGIIFERYGFSYFVSNMDAILNGLL